MLAAPPQNHTDVASLGVSCGLLCQRPHILYRLVLLHSALCQFGLDFNKLGYTRPFSYEAMLTCADKIEYMVPNSIEQVPLHDFLLKQQKVARSVCSFPLVLYYLF